MNGARCSRCGWHEQHPKTGLVPLEVNHKNGDSTNNSPTISSYCVQIVIPLQTTLETSTKVTVGSGVLQNKP